MDILIKDYNIRRLVKRLATEISEDYHKSLHDTPIVLVGVLSGAMPLLIDLSRQIDADIPVRIETIKCSSYTGMLRGKLKVGKLPKIGPYHKIIIVDDIVDSGQTMTTLVKKFRKKYKLCQIRTCSLLKRAGTDFNVSYLGKIVAKNLWLIGYGLDDNGIKRNLTDIYIKG